MKTYYLQILPTMVEYKITADRTSILDGVIIFHDEHSNMVACFPGQSTIIYKIELAPAPAQTEKVNLKIAVPEPPTPPKDRYIREGHQPPKPQ